MSFLTYNGKHIAINNQFLSIPTVSDPVYNLRDIGPAGGLIFYINENYSTDGWKYLESAPSDADSLTIRWSNITNVFEGGTAKTIGAGAGNTTTITANSSSGAAFSCDSSIINTYSDWFLGSQDEVDLMYQNLHLQGVGNFTASSYWTSSEDTSTNAFRQTFNGGAKSSSAKSTYYRIRPVRRFTSVEKFNVTYNGNGYTSGTLPTNLSSIIKGTDISIGTPSNLYRDTDEFIGWNTSADGTGTDYAAGTSIKLASSMTLYAKWKTYTLAFLPDTQSYTRWKHSAFTSQIDWLINNKDALNLKFVGHEGDLVQSFDTSIGEWEFAQSEMNQLYDASIPYSTLPGNHDYKELTRDSSMYNSYFPLSYFEDMPTYQGAFEENKSDNTYHKVNINGNNLLILSLEFGPRDEVVSWANNILQDNSTMKALVLVHSYLKYDGELLAPGDNHAPSNGYGLGSNVNDGTDLWTDLIYPNNNVAFVICGHDGTSTDGSGLRISTHSNGSSIYQIMSNYQYYSSYPGYLVLLKFSSSRVDFKTYSPYIQEYKSDSESQASWNWSF